MVAIFTGAGTGFERGSGNVLGSAGLLGVASMGRGGDQVFLNAATGNLLISRQDEFLVGRGPDVGVGRTYNSFGAQSDDNGDNWQQSTDRRIFDLTGTGNSWGSTVKRRSADGSEMTYEWNGSAYATTEGAGSYDTLTYNGSTWTWTDGDSRVTETYGAYGSYWRITAQADADGNSLAFAYTGDKLTRVSTANGEYIDYVWSGSHISEVVSGDGTGTFYVYDSLDRLSRVEVELTGGGSRYVTTYTYDGSSKRVASISQTDGSQVAFTYDTAARIKTIVETVAAGTTRTTTLTYGTGYTTVTDPAGQVTRLDYAPGNIAPQLETWASSNVTKEATFIDGRAATKYTVQTGGTTSFISGGTLSVVAGETIAFAMTLQAFGAVTSQRLGIYGSSEGWGANDISAARIVSGPGQLVQAGGLWRVDGLSTSEGTRIEITRTFKQAQSIGVYLYIDGPGGYRAGTSLLAADPVLLKSSTAASLAQMDLGNWGFRGASASLTGGTIHGSPAYQLTVTDHNWSGGSCSLGTAKAGDQFSMSMSLQAAVGGATSQAFGIYGSASGWGYNGLGSARIISGPGTLVQLAGGFWRVDGLSTTQPTRVEIVRTYDREESAQAYIYADYPGGHRVDQSLIAGAPYIVRRNAVDAGSGQLLKITAPPAYSGAAAQVVQFGYNDNGDLTSVTDGLGNTTSYTYDANGNLLTSTDRLGNVVTRTYNAQNQLLTEARTGSDADGASVVHTVRYVYDAERHLVYSVSAEGYVTEYKYQASGELVQTIEYPEDGYAGTGFAKADLDSWRAANADASAKVTEHSYDVRGNLTATKTYAVASGTGGPYGTPAGTVTYNYDRWGKLLSRSVQGQNSESFVYDGLGRVVSSVDVNGATTSIAFNDAATQTVVTLANGLVQTSTYNKAGELVSSTSSSDAYTPAGNAVYAYDPLGRLRIASVYYDVANGLHTDSYVVYDKVGRKVADIDHYGSLTEYRYDANDRIVASVRYTTRITAAQLTTLQNPASNVEMASIRPAANAADVWTWHAYDKEGRVVKDMAGDGGVTAYDYDASGRLIRTTGFYNKLSAAQLSALKADPAAAVALPAAHAKDSVARSFYDKDGRLLGVLDGEGFLTRSYYDKAGQKVRELAFAAATNSSLRASGTLAALTSGLAGSSDRQTDYVYDGRGLLRYRVDALRQVTEYAYNAAGRVVQTIGYAGSIAATSDYSCDNIAALVASSGLGSSAATRRTSAVYDAAGRLAYAIDAENAVTGYRYDAMGNATRVVRYAVQRATTAAPSLADMTAWESGQASNANNRVTRNYYDDRNALRFVVDALGYVTRSDYDAKGRRIATTRWSNAIAATDATTIANVAAAVGGTTVTTSYWYDHDDRVSRVFDGEGYHTSYYYYPNGTLEWEIVMEGTADERRTHYVHDAAGHLLGKTEAHGVAGLEATTSYAYDGLGNLLTVTDPLGATTSYGYDRLGQVVSEIDALSGVVAHQYDAFGNVTRTTDARGGQSYFYYDRLDRLVATRDALNYVTEIAYTVFGETAATTRRYNATTSPVASLPTVTAHAGDLTRFAYYDRLGRQVQSADGEKGVTATQYSAFGEVTQVTHYYNPASNTPSATVAPTVTAHAKDATTKFEYDELGRLARTIDAETATTGGTDYYHEDYGYDAFGNRTQVTNRLGAVTTYTFDKRGLVLTEAVAIDANYGSGVTSTTITTQYQYDARGNRKQMVEAYGTAEARTTYYLYDRLDRLIDKHGTSVAVGFGSATAVPTELYAYDLAGRLIQATDANGARTLYRYDALGRRIGQIVQTSASLGAYTGYDYDANGNQTKLRTYAALVAMPATATSAWPTPSGTSRETVSSYDALDRLTDVSIAGQLVGSWNGTSYVTSTAALVTHYQYDAAGNVVRTQDPAGGEVFAYYDRAGRKVAEADQEQYLTVWTYDGQGNVLSERRHAGKATGISVSGYTAPATSAADRVTTFVYDRLGRRLNERREGLEAWTLNTSTGQLAAAGGASSIQYAYNALGQVTQKIEATGDTFLYTYDEAGRLIVERRPGYAEAPGGAAIAPTLRYYYNGLGLLTSTVQGRSATSADDRTTTNVYMAGGRLDYVQDAEGNRRNYRYDAAGRVIGETYARRLGDGTAPTNGTVVTEGISYQYDLAGNVTRQAINSISGSSWTELSYTASEYDGFGQLVRRGTGANGTASPAVWQEQFFYDGAGRLIKSNAGDGVWRHYAYDAAGRQTMMIESEGTDISGWSQASAVANAAAAGVNATVTQYDARGQAVKTIQRARQLSVGGLSQDLVTTRGYTAFGEVAWEKDALGGQTDYSYNTMGRVLQIQRPTVSVTADNGAQSNIRPTEKFFYDVSGRLIGTQDANSVWLGTNVKTTRQLLAGTGYGPGSGSGAGGEALVVKEWHPDGGVRTNGYNAFGDLVLAIDEIGRTTSMAYDKLGRLVQVTRPGGLDDYYAYDLLGQRIGHWNEVTGYAGRERTQYDALGRVTLSQAFGGDQTSTGYQWSDTVAPSGLGATLGGWTATTSYANGKTLVETASLYGQVTSRTDLGGHTTSFTYDRAGRMTGSSTTGETKAYAWLDTGLIGSVTAATAGIATVQTSTYDARGNKLSEVTTRAGTTIQNATATYDALGRLLTWSEAGNGSATPVLPAASMTYAYDANSNVRRIQSSGSYLDQNGAPLSFVAQQDQWYAYDSMNRMTVSGGRLANGAVTGGTQVSYDAAGQRTSVATMSSALVWTGWKGSYKNGGGYVYSDYPGDYSEDGLVWTHTGRTTYSGKVVETYSYAADGSLASVSVSEEGVSVDWGVFTNTGVMSASVLRASFAYDLQGRLASQTDYQDDGTTVAFSRTELWYDAAGRMYHEMQTSRQGADTLVTYLDTSFGAGTSAYALGAVTSVGGVTFKNGSNSAVPDTLTTNYYAWYEGAVLSNVNYKPDASGSTTYYTSYGLTPSGQTQSASIGISLTDRIESLGMLRRVRFLRWRRISAPQSSTGARPWRNISSLIGASRRMICSASRGSTASEPWPPLAPMLAAIWFSTRGSRLSTARSPCAPRSWWQMT